MVLAASELARAGTAQPKAVKDEPKGTDRPVRPGRRVPVVRPARPSSGSRWPRVLAPCATPVPTHRPGRR